VSRWSSFPFLDQGRPVGGGVFERQQGPQFPFFRLGSSVNGEVVVRFSPFSLLPSPLSRLEGGCMSRGRAETTPLFPSPVEGVGTSRFLVGLGVLGVPPPPPFFPSFTLRELRPPESEKTVGPGFFLFPFLFPPPPSRVRRRVRRSFFSLFHTPPCCFFFSLPFSFAGPGRNRVRLPRLNTPYRRCFPLHLLFPSFARAVIRVTKFLPVFPPPLLSKREKTGPQNRNFTPPSPFFFPQKGIVGGEGRDKGAPPSPFPFSPPPGIKAKASAARRATLRQNLFFPFSREAQKRRGALFFFPLRSIRPPPFSKRPWSPSAMTHRSPLSATSASLSFSSPKLGCS